MVNFKNLAVAAAGLFSSGLALPYTEKAVSGSVVKDSYIVTLRSGQYSIDNHLSWVDHVHGRSLNKRGLGGVVHTFANIDGFRAYSGEFDEATIEEIKKNSDVLFVEEDRVWVIDTVDGKHYDHTPGQRRRDTTTQTDAPWGLGAISSLEPGSSTYTYDSAAGVGTYAYVVDTGIRVSHEDFGGRAILGHTVFPGDSEDTNGHGTHVAGTVAGAQYGVVKNAIPIGVKVFQGSTTTTTAVMQGYGWAVEDIIQKNRTGKAVINMSLGGSFSDAMNKAVNDASAAGVITIAAAGNFNQNSDDASPASATTAITVGAVDITWTIWASSNWGPSLDIFAPGVNVLSADVDSDTAFSEKSGTSMAAPHVAGMVLYAMSVHRISGVEAITNHILENGIPDVVKGNIKTSVNLMANLGESA